MAYQNIRSLSDPEAFLLTTLAAAGKEVFTTRDAYEVLSEGRPARDALGRLVQKGWLERIEKGKYLIVPLEAGPDRSWTEDAFVVARHLVEPGAIAYWSALNHWNLTEQVPRITYIQTPARKSNRRPEVLGMKFRIVLIKDERFFGLHAFRVDETSVQVTDREKSLIDCLDRPDLSGGVVEVAGALQEGDGELEWEKMTQYLGRFGSGAVVKRLGFLAEASELDHPPGPNVLDQWQGLLTAGISQLDPTSPRESHRIVTRWRVSVNVPEDGLTAPA